MENCKVKNKRIRNLVFIENRQFHFLNKGFTLLELLTVMVILGAVAAIAVPIFTNKSVTAKQNVHNGNVSILQKQGNAYLLAMTKLPDQDKELIHDLETYGYIKEIPTNPITGVKDYSVIYNVLKQRIEVTTESENITDIGGGTGGDGEESSGPTLEITANTENITEEHSILYTFTFSEAVTGFDSSDIVIENGTPGEFIEISNTVYTMVVMNSGPCVQIIGVASGACKSTNNKSNQAASKSIIIVDETAPAAPTFSANPVTPTNGNVTVTIIYSHDSNIKEYKIGTGETWMSYTSAVVITANNTLYARSKDLSGNMSTESSISITNIDKTAPAPPTASVASGTYESIQNITLLGEDGAIIRYTTNGSNPTTSSTVYSNVLEVNETTNLKVRQWDAAGNASTVASYTYNIIIIYNANIPKLVTGMTPVKWVGASGLAIETDTTEADTEWYKYNGDIESTKSTSGTGAFTADKWANVRLGDTTSGGSLFVWIPRYTYKITKNGLNSKIQIKYSNGIIDDNTDSFKSHPAFVVNGKQLTGIWVAKFEASSYEGTVKIRPGVQSWRNITVNDIFNVCREMQNLGNPYGISSDTNVVDTHMMKNSEWGAVAYLAEAIRDGNQIWINNNTNYITGSAGSSSDASSTSTSVEYTSIQGRKASTTGNEYGIYDMCGGAAEYVASYVVNGNANLTTYGNSLVTAVVKYKNNLTLPSNIDQGQTGNYSHTSLQTDGMALHEVMTGGTGENPFQGYKDKQYFPYASYPFFARGGSASGNSPSSGLFACEDYNGRGNTSFISFRPVIWSFQ